MKTWVRNICILALLIACWQLTIMVCTLPVFILPSPWLVWKTFTQQFPLLFHHAVITCYEIIAGLLLGVGIGCITALAMDRFRPLKYGLQPIVIASQSLPTFVIAPLLVFWLGYGTSSKLIITAFMIFFPITNNLLDGLQRTPTEWLNLAKTMGASPWKLLMMIRLPAALPALASGIRIATAIAPLGAIIGEWVGASQGLGFLMLEANARMQIDLMFAALLLVLALAFALYFTIDRLLLRLIPWRMH